MKQIIMNNLKKIKMYYAGQIMRNAREHCVRPTLLKTIDGRLRETGLAWNVTTRYKEQKKWEYMGQLQPTPVDATINEWIRIYYSTSDYSHLYVRSLFYGIHRVCRYSGTSLIRSPMGLGKSDRNGEVTVLQAANLHCGIQHGTEQGWP